MRHHSSGSAPRPHLLASRSRAFILTLSLAAGGWMSGAPIPGLYNTGVDDTGALLGPSAVDPHYTLIESADAEFVGPDIFTLAPGFPVGPWLAEGPLSRWIAPRAQQGIGNAEGNYVVRTTFDLTGFDATRARINGKWAVDNTGSDIVLNGISLGIVNGGGFGGFTDFVIESGFIDGTNTLDFVVFNAPATPNPVGLRVEMLGTVEVEGEAPRILTAPQAASVFAGEDVILSVSADGTPPLEYRWTRNGEPVDNGSEATLSLFGIAPEQEGLYEVLITNGSGEARATAAVQVLTPIPGLFPTGVLDDQGILLEDGASDLHYRITVNPDGEPMDAIVQDSTVFPIGDGTWLFNSEFSKWVGPRFETSGAAGGDYTFETLLDLTGFDPATVLVRGTWTGDNAGQIWVNGLNTGVSHAGNFNTLNPFVITNGFLSGTNRIEFRINNASAGYVGLRVETIRAGGKPAGSGPVAPRIVTAPVGGFALTGDSFSLQVVADGDAPLSFQWFRGETGLDGQTNALLQLNPLTLADEGSYSVRITNPAGTTNTPAVSLTVLDPVPGAFSTGVDATGAPLPDGESDPHYFISVNADGEPIQAIVLDSTAFPIVTGPWIANSATSKWIGPRFVNVESAGGDYVYRTTVDLTGFDPATARLFGSWTSDNSGTDIAVNGTSSGVANTGAFGALSPFVVSTGFVAGVNTVEFKLNNADAVAGYTGLRVEGLKLGARAASTGGAPALTVTLTGGQLVISWPTSAAGYRLTSAPTLGSTTWADVNAPVVVVGDRNQVTLAPSADASLYRLQN